MRTRYATCEPEYCMTHFKSQWKHSTIKYANCPIPRWTWTSGHDIAHCAPLGKGNPKSSNPKRLNSSNVDRIFTVCSNFWFLSKGLFQSLLNYDGIDRFNECWHDSSKIEYIFQSGILAVKQFLNEFRNYNSVFQQDNSSVLENRSTKLLLESHQIIPLEWPAHSPQKHAT